MNTCKNCKYWMRFPLTFFGSCNCSKFIDMSQSIYYHNNLNDNICFSDIDNKEAFFATGELFGCIHFKKKEKI